VTGGAFFGSAEAFLAVVAGAAMLAVMHVDPFANLTGRCHHAEAPGMTIGTGRFFEVNVRSVPESHFAGAVRTADELNI